MIVFSALPCCPEKSSKIARIPWPSASLALCCEVVEIDYRGCHSAFQFASVPLKEEVHRQEELNTSCIGLKTMEV